jgi:phage terminase large subunit
MYHYPEVKEGNEKEEPVKEDDHLMDAIRYAVYTYQPRPTAPIVYYKPLPNPAR